MKKKKMEFQDLINKDKYQVFLFVCRAHFPFGFAAHPWFVVNHKGTISRYEVLYTKIELSDGGFGHLAVNNQPPLQGIPIFSFCKKFLRNAKNVWSIEGEENSLAREFVAFIEKSKQQYPYLNKYSLVGPNSNTYVNWVFSNFPTLNVKLPWNFIGKNYKM